MSALYAKETPAHSYSDLIADADVATYVGKLNNKVFSGYDAKTKNTFPALKIISAIDMARVVEQLGTRSGRKRS